jgi:UDP-N-acetylmuramyl pentapeptide phosphotransferase/UDP-N-acetylglucosamine-1-phosphate transferase
MVAMLLVTLVAAFGLSLVTCALALLLFPWFRSGERKPGAPDQSTGGFRAVVRRGRRGKRTWMVRSSELPLVGGAAMLIAIAIAVVGVGLFLNLDFAQWEVLGILLGAMAGYGLIGWVDDWFKVHRGQGITEPTKFVGVFAVSAGSVVAMNRLVASARFAYSPYSQIPGLGWSLQHTPYVWVIFFLVMATTVATTTSLAVDFTDGLDGLAGGTLVSAALSFAIIILNQSGPLNWPAELVVLAMLGALLGYLPFNWPSGWKARGQGRSTRHARLIMGDTGSLALGGALALVTIETRRELLLVFVGGVFVLEGVSAVISARVLTKFFRHFLSMPRFQGEQKVPHTEFPLPFLGTPLHHHYDLLDWDRQRLVYAAWTLAAGLGALGVASAIEPFTWERYLTRFLALGIIAAVWQVGPWTRTFFIGLVPAPGAAPGDPARLGLFYGLPYRLFGWRLYAHRDTVAATEAVLVSAAERAGLWQRTSVFDARAILGYYCYRSGHDRDALRVWERIPESNLHMRPEIAALVAEVRGRVALEADGGFLAALEPEVALPPVPATAIVADTAAVAPEPEPWELPPMRGMEAPALDLAAEMEDTGSVLAADDRRDVTGTQPGSPLSAALAREAHWQPAQTGLRATRLEPVGPGTPPELAGASGSPRWDGPGWAATPADSIGLIQPAPGPDPSIEPDRDQTTERPANGLRPPYAW